MYHPAGSYYGDPTPPLPPVTGWKYYNHLDGSGSINGFQDDDKLTVMPTGMLGIKNTKNVQQPSYLSGSFMKMLGTE